MERLAAKRAFFVPFGLLWHSNKLNSNPETLLSRIGKEKR